MGILLVHGGVSASALSWLKICLKNIFCHTSWPDYEIYLWNNNPEDDRIAGIVKSHNNIKLTQAPAREELKHPHATPLQKLYEFALKDHVHYVVTMDTDAFPLRNDWLRFLISQLNEQTLLAGIWRNELEKAIPPYIHPSCACMAVDFIETYHLRFDHVDISPGNRLDTLCSFTRRVGENNKQLFKLTRSNKNQLHYLMGGVYGDLIYHHGAGSRKGITFWGEDKSEFLQRRNVAIHSALRSMLFNHEPQYLAWLMGQEMVWPESKPGAKEFFDEIEKLKQKLLEMDADQA